MDKVYRNMIEYVPMEKKRYACDFCGKGVQNSNLVSFSKNRVHKVRRPNLHAHKMKIEGEAVHLKLCTSCKRTVRASEKVAKPEVVVSAH